MARVNYFEIRFVMYNQSMTDQNVEKYYIKGCHPSLLATFSHLFMCENEDENLQRVQGFLSDTGASIHLTTESGETLLHWACSRNHPRIVQFLLSQGANAAAKCDFWRTPLHAVSGHRNVVDIIDALLDAGADIEATDGHGLTPLMVGLSYISASLHDDWSSVERLVERGANILATRPMEEPPALRIGKNQPSGARLLALARAAAEKRDLDAQTPPAPTRPGKRF